MQTGPRSVAVAVVVAASWVLAPSAAATRHSASSPARDPATLIADVAALADPALEGRLASSPGGRRARAWIESAFRSIGLRPAATSSYAQPFSFTLRRLSGILLPGPFRREYRDAANVVGRLDGADPALAPIVVSAHYDHLGVVDGVVYPGADDNASGVASMLAVARFMKDRAHRHPLVFAAFDAEELGLRGARVFVGSTGAGFALNVNLDMVSRSARREIYVAGTHHTPRLRPIIEALQPKTPVAIRFGHDRPELGPDDWTMLSDHGAFHQKGVPFVYFGVEDHEDYHQPTDTLDRIDRQFFADVTALVVDAVVALDRALPSTYVRAGLQPRP